MVCAREGCNEPLSTGKSFCSPKCSANRSKPKVLSAPASIEDIVRAASPDGAAEILRQMQITLQADDITVPDFDTVRTHGDWRLDFSGGREYKPNSAIDYDTIYDMERSGVVAFAKEMKASGILAAFRSPQTRTLVSPDKPLMDAMNESLRRFFFLGMADAVDAAIGYGASFQEIEWINMTAYELGLSNSRSATQMWTVINSLKSVNPSTVSHMLRDKNRKFNGFVQNGTLTDFRDITVKRENSLVISYNEKFRNKWGISMYELMYPYWFWYQIVLRSMVRYMERQGTPVAVVKAPSKFNVRKPGTTETVNALVWAQQVASSIGFSSAVAIPSDPDPETGKPMWDASYLVSEERSESFISVLESLTQMILRSAILGDRSVSKDSGSTGSNAQAEIHMEATRIHDDKIVSGILHTLNENIFPRLSVYNRGVKNPPPLWMIVKGLSQRDRDIIMKLFNVAGNSPEAQEALGRVDYETMAIDGGIAYLSQGEYEKRRNELEQYSLDKQGRQAEMQHELAKKYDTGEEEESSKELDATIQALVKGDRLPIFMSKRDLEGVNDKS